MTRRSSLLVVDDYEANREVLSRRLRPKGYDVAVAANGEEALTQIAMGLHDLVLLDVQMPGISGLEVLTSARRQYSSTELPIIMVSGRTDGGDVVEALRLGANDYLTKPIDFSAALARIGTHLAHKSASSTTSPR